MASLSFISNTTPAVESWKVSVSNQKETPDESELLLRNSRREAELPVRDRL